MVEQRIEAPCVVRSIRTPGKLIGTHKKKRFVLFCANQNIAQSGSASALGAVGHRFESCYSDWTLYTKKGEGFLQAF